MLVFGFVLTTGIFFIADEVDETCRFTWSAVDNGYNSAGNQSPISDGAAAKTSILSSRQVSISNEIIFIGLQSSNHYYHRPGGVVGVYGRVIWV